MRHTLNADERRETDEIERSTKTSTYLTDEFWESIHAGIKPPAVSVPNYRQPTAGEIHMDFDQVFDTASDALGPDQTKLAASRSDTPRDDGEKTFATVPSKVTHPSLTVSRNQAMAIKKYPALIEFLGQPEGEQVANNISGHLNVFIAEKIAVNTKEAHPEALKCQVDKQNFRQYFQGPGWICRVTASGPFKGNEVIYYRRESDTASILQRTERSGQVKYSDISSDFNIIFESGETETLPEEITEVANPAKKAVVAKNIGEKNDNGTDVDSKEVAGQKVEEPEVAQQI